VVLPCITQLYVFLTKKQSMLNAFHPFAHEEPPQSFQWIQLSQRATTVTSLICFQSQIFEIYDGTVDFNWKEVQRSVFVLFGWENQNLISSLECRKRVAGAVTFENPHSIKHKTNLEGTPKVAFVILFF